MRQHIIRTARDPWAKWSIIVGLLAVIAVSTALLVSTK